MWLVSKQIKLAAIAPTHLNLNGDLGNLLVLQKRLEWRGVSSSITHLQGPEELQDFDYVLLGHGSNAAWLQLLQRSSDLFERCVSYIEASGALLAVASGADRLMPLLTGVEIQNGDRVSEFVSEDSVVGYLNTTSKADRLLWHKNALLTQLHGPVLAKNPGLADGILAMNDWVDISISNEQLAAVDDLAALSRKTAFEH